MFEIRVIGDSPGSGKTLIALSIIKIMNYKYQNVVF